MPTPSEAPLVEASKITGTETARGRVRTPAAAPLKTPAQAPVQSGKPTIQSGKP